MSCKTSPPFDIGAAHRHFSTACYNEAWILIEKADRTSHHDEAMVLCALASLWHWTQRPDCNDKSLSIGHWQVSRVYALAGQGENAMRHAQRSLDLAVECSPFFIGYAHEAMARAATMLADQEIFLSHLEQAKACAAATADSSERALLEKDLRLLSDSRSPTP